MLTTDGDTASATSVSAVSNATALDRASWSTAPFRGDADAVPSMVITSVALRAMTQGSRNVVRNMNIPSFAHLTFRVSA
jgi:hypothetical protein